MDDDFLNPLDALLHVQPMPLPLEAASVVNVAPQEPSAIPDSAARWNRVFADAGDAYFFGREPSPLVRRAFQYWEDLRGEERGPLLDLGCGEGRDAVWLAGRGFRVTAVDGSEVGLAKLARLAGEAGVSPTRRQCDIRQYRPDFAFPFLVANNCLQFLGSDCLPLLREWQARTPMGGMNAVSIMTRACVPEQAGLYRFASDELRTDYADWRLLFYSEDMVWREPSGRHLSFAQIVAVKI